MSKKRIITLCGSGIASSTICAQKIKKACEEQKIDADIKAISFRELDGVLEHIDLIVSVTPNVKFKDVPVINGVPFLTGIGQKEVIDKAIKILKGGEK